MNIRLSLEKANSNMLGFCLDLNVSARGVDLADVEKNLFAAIQLYLQDIEENPDTEVSPIPTVELIEFLQDTEPERHKKKSKNLFTGTI